MRYIPGVRVIVLFPFDEVSRSQRKMMTTLADNVRTVAIDGKFDDCQAMVKRAFADPAFLFEVPKDGDYIMAITDAIYRGREDFVYRVSIGELPFVSR